MPNHKTVQIVLELIKKAVIDSYELNTDLFSGANWPEVISLSKEQGVIGVAFDSLQSLPKDHQPDSHNLLAWIGYVSLLEKRYKLHENSLRELTDLYNKNGIKMMVLKGWGLSLFYPIPCRRPMGDLDIWLFGEQKRADELMLKYDIHPVKSSHHTIFFFKGVEVENHITFIEVDCHKADGSEEVLLKYSTETTTGKTTENGGKILLPTPNFNAYFLIKHASAHFATEKITLRHILDWALFVNNHYNEIDWGILYENAKKRNMHIFLDCQNAICVDYLGFPANRFPIINRYPNIETRVFNDIIYPEFKEIIPNINKHFIRYCYTKAKRQIANKWKYKITYKENFWSIFIRFSLNRLKESNKLPLNEITSKGRGLEI